MNIFKSCGIKLQDIHPKCTNNTEKIRIEYKSSFTNKEDFLIRLRKNREKDLFKGYTTIGTHRDDFEIFINNNLLNVYGSQGQHRTVVLSLKIAEMEILKDETNENPVLLLDDVTSELDLERINLIFSTIKDYQVFITCTDASSIVNNEYLTNHIKLYKISKGTFESII